MPQRETLLRIFAVLIGLRALTNVFKPFGAGSGLVFLGKLWTGWVNTILAPLLGFYMLYYAYAIWTRRSIALPMGIAYAILVSINLVLFPVIENLPPGVTGFRYLIFGIVGFAIPWATVWLLRQRVEE